MKKIDGRGITHRIDISNDYLVIKISIAVRNVEFLVFFFIRDERKSHLFDSVMY